MAESDDKFPWQQLGVLAICRLAEPVAFVSIVAYAFVMVQEINGEKDASFYAGLLVSAFALAEASTCWIWGHLSDRWGRKPIIMVALAGTALSSLLFGFATKYWIALLARVVGGALNGNVAVMQTMVAEMVKRPEHEPRAYALQPFMWSLGAIAGSSLGGFTAQPAKYYPGLFSQDGIFGRFPYLLPNLIAVAVILAAMILGFLFLEETNPALVSQKRAPTEPDTAQIAHETTPLLRARTERASSIATARSGGSVPYVAVQVPIPNDPNFDLRRSSIASTKRKRTTPSIESTTPKKPRLPTTPSAKAVTPENNLKDSLREGLILVSIGLNPGIMTGKLGHAYSHPTNRYWPTLHASGITPILHKPPETHFLMDLYGLGHTNIITNIASVDASSLKTQDYMTGAAALDAKIRHFKPQAVAIVGKGIWEEWVRYKKGRKFNAKKDGFEYGWQDPSLWIGRKEDGDDAWEGAKTFVTTTTSGASTAHTKEQRVAIWKPLGDWFAPKRDEWTKNKREEELS